MSKRLRLVMLAGVLVLFVAACGDGGASSEASVPTTVVTTSATTTAPSTTTTSAPFTRQAPEAVLLNLAWENETCTYEGPTGITAGPVELVYRNGTEVPGYVNFLKLDEGYTPEDAYNRNPWPTSQSRPFWTTELNTRSSVSPGVTASWVRDLDPGDYFMVCGRWQPAEFVWWGGGFSVQD